MEIDDQVGSAYACDCGQEYMSEETLKRHQQNNCKNRSIKCSFCDETLSSSAALRDHLLLCGNKTDQCPNCHQFIRRSHFAYHYESNCAPVDNVETPPSRPKFQPVNRLPPNYNKPIRREDVPSDHYAENYPVQNLPKANGIIQSPVPKIQHSPVIIECEYCRQRCAQNDYETHRENCLHNPANINQRQPPRIPLRPKQSQSPSNGIVHIPCEICNQQIDLPNWSNHTQNCRERDRQRMKNLANSMSRDPVTERLPCEHCHQMYTAKLLRSHEINCPNNPDNVDAAARLARPRPSPVVFLPIKPKDNRNHPTPSNVRSPDDGRFAQYQKIDIARTHAANRSPSNDRSNNHQHVIKRTASDEILSPSHNSPRDVRAYNNDLVRSNVHRSYDDISPHDPSQRKRSLSSNSRNINDRQDRHLYHGSERTVIIDNQPGRPSVKQHNKQSWLSKFFCGTKGVYD